MLCCDVNLTRISKTTSLFCQYKWQHLEALETHTHTHTLILFHPLLLNYCSRL